MGSNPENRDKTRFEHEAAVTLENNKNGVHRRARMYNYSDRGLYIETDHLLEPETEIRIGVSNSPFSAEPDTYDSFRGVIKWRRVLKRAAFYYGYGIELIEKETYGDSDENPYVESRQHSRADFVVPVKYESDDQSYEGNTENLSSDGVFIKTRDPVAVDQTVKIDIPLKKKGKIKRLTGKVVRSTGNGFGVQFDRSD